MIEQAFDVAAEFKFDVGQALINTKALQQGVDNLSQTAGQAMGALNYLASGLVAHLGFGSGGILTALTQAVRISDEFDQASLGFSNNITENFRLLSGTINTFNDRLRTSEMIMGKISDQAIKFGLDTNELGDLSRRLATPLAQHGKLGQDYEGATTMARNLMMASMNTGIHPMAASESLYRALSDRMPLHGQLFARLANTEAFKSAHVTQQGQLQNMNTDKKIDLLGKALESLGMDAEALQHRLHTLKAQFTIMKDWLMKVLGPIGAAIKEPLIKVMEFLNGWLAENGEKVGKSIGKFISSFIDSPKEALIGLLQLKELGHDFKKSLHIVELYGTFKFISFLLNFLGVQLGGGLLLRGLRALWTGLAYLFDIIPWSQLFTGAMWLLRTALVEVLPILLAALFVFQSLSRARAVAKVHDAEKVAELGPKFLDLIARAKIAIMNILTPITMLIDGFAQLLAPIFEWSFWLEVLLPVFEGFVMVLEDLGKGVIYAMAGLSGLTNAIIGLIYEPMKWANMKKNFAEGYNDFLSKHPFAPGSKDMPTPSVTNNNHIEARFDMREQLEPDRIAFAVTEHLKNLAINPRQSRGNSLAGGLAGAAYYGGHASPFGE